MEASNYIQAIEKRQGFKIAYIVEITFEKRYISKNNLLFMSEPMKKNGYGQYLINRVKHLE